MTIDPALRKSETALLTISNMFLMQKQQVNRLQVYCGYITKIPKPFCEHKTYPETKN